MDNFDFYRGEIVKEASTIHFWDDGIEWRYRIIDSKRLREALSLACQAIDDWYDVEGHPDFEDLCIGDVADIYLEDAGIEYEYLGGNYYDEA